VEQMETMASVLEVDSKQMSPLMDSVPVLITQLCVAHVNNNIQKKSNPTASCFHLLRQKQLKIRQLKIKAFETIFNYLKEQKSRYVIDCIF